MKCTVCRGGAVIAIRRHNSHFCADHFLRHCREQVAKAIKDFAMLSPGDRVLVAVSGGKDSLAVWDILLDLGYDADGFIIGLGIGEYSNTSTQYARDYAQKRGVTLLEVDLPDEYGYDIPDGSRAARRAPCSACGLTKRHLFDKAAVDGGYDVVVTGHNLDDEAAVLFGNVLHWHTDYLGRQSPVLAARSGFPKKVKPLVRLGEREMAAYCVVRGIDYIVDECPMADGNRHLHYKDALNAVEARSPGAKFDFYHRYLSHAAAAFRIADEDDPLGSCARCGAPCSGEICAFCRLVERATTPQPVTLGPRRRRGRGSSIPATPASATTTEPEPEPELEERPA
jgi:tRNA-5-methyluridine54 2-sulfurtransferase